MGTTGATMLNKALTSTNFFFKNQTKFYRGKVRDVYAINNEYIVLIACDRLSAFDHVLPKSIPFKGQILTEVASYFLEQTEDILPNWKLATPDPQVMVGHYCTPIELEFVVRGYLVGHAWRIYKSGERNICGNILPEGLVKNQKLPTPILTPAVKAKDGHDVDISAEEIIKQKHMKKKDFEFLKKKSFELYERGYEHAKKQGLILVDTKYEFGTKNDTFYLIDEIHTPDSSRFFYANTYDQLLKEGKDQRQLSKEFVREWLIEHDFMGLEGQTIPNLDDEFIEMVKGRYIEIYEKLLGKKFNHRNYEKINETIEKNINNYLTIINTKK